MIKIEQVESEHGCLAQLVERRPYKAKVGGSIPSAPTTLFFYMVEAKKNERANALKEVKRLCKELGFTAGMLKGTFAAGRNKKHLAKP